MLLTTVALQSVAPGLEDYVYRHRAFPAYSQVKVLTLLDWFILLLLMHEKGNDDSSVSLCNPLGT